MKNPKSEIRNPKEVRSPKAEMAVRLLAGYSDLGIWVSFVIRPSAFGFLVS
ncbi:MAG: hypothetical protein HY735_18275 [Verrucomicrobia bacterium]|nr:hypothetical protein [Verrucomicrobiota bacterium]